MLRAISTSIFAVVVLLAAGGCPRSELHQAGGTLAAPPPDTAAPPPPARKPKRFSRGTEGCEQIWSCDCRGVAAKQGCHLDRSVDEATSGACAADSGPPSGCTRCLALPPAPACACKNVCP